MIVSGIKRDTIFGIYKIAKFWKQFEEKKRPKELNILIFSPKNLFFG